MQVAQGGTLLDSIAEFCRANGVAESTFGRRAVNDGKFVSRLRDGARVTPETLQRVSAYLERHGATAPGAPPELRALVRIAERPAPAATTAADSPSRQFRFFDNRQKYPLFVNTCSEKEGIAHRIGMELAHLHPTPPAVRVFESPGVGLY